MKKQTNTYELQKNYENPTKDNINLEDTLIIIEKYNINEQVLSGITNINKKRISSISNHVPLNMHKLYTRNYENAIVYTKKDKRLLIGEKVPDRYLEFLKHKTP